MRSRTCLLVGLFACGSEAPIEDRDATEAPDAASIHPDASAVDALSGDAMREDATPVDAGSADAGTSTRADSGFNFQREIVDRVTCTLPETPDAEEWRVRFHSGLLRVYSRAPLTAEQKAEVLRDVGAVRFHCEDEEPQRTSLYSLDMGSSASLGTRAAQGRLLEAKPFVLAASAIIADTSATYVPPETDDEAVWQVDRSSSPNHSALHGIPGLGEYVASYLDAGHSVGAISVGLMDTPVFTNSCAVGELPPVQDGCSWTTPCALTPYGSMKSDHGSLVAHVMAGLSNGNTTCLTREGSGLLGGLKGVSVQLTAFTFYGILDAGGGVVVDADQVALRGVRDACGLPAVNHSWGPDIGQYLTLTGTVAAAWFSEGVRRRAPRRDAPVSADAARPGGRQ